MRWKNTETTTFAGSAGSNGKPAIVETMQLLDREGVEVATFSKAVDGMLALTVDGSPVGGASVFNIRDYGAAVDGVTDDAAAVAATIDAVIAADGGVVYFPRGTTLMRSAMSIRNFGANDLGSVIFRGSGTDSCIQFADTGGYGIYTGNTRSVVYEDLTFLGETSGGVSTSSADTTTTIIASTSWDVTFNRCNFAGIGASGALGMIYIEQCYGAVFRDCIFGGCTGPTGGLIYADGTRSLLVENCTFVDYFYLGGINYSKYAGVGNTKNWIRVRNIPALNGMVVPAVRIVDSRFDENTTESLINIVGTADDTVEIVNCSFNGGLSSYPPVVVDTLHRLYVRGMWAGLNTGTWSSIVADDVANVDIEGLIHDNGATDIQLTGTTKRLKLRNCQDVTITNTAAAFIDADQAMPATASATALAPLGAVTHVTGTTAITSITTTNLKAGDVIKLIFDSTATLTDGNNIKAAGNLVATADDSWTGVYDGTNVYEVARSVN